MAQNSIAKGQCLCGSVKVQFEVKEKNFDVCHCSMCRTWGGGPAFTIDASSAPKFKGEEFITLYDSSSWAERAFCKCCGTHLYYRRKKTGFQNFSLALIEGNEHYKFDQQLFVDKKPGNYSFANHTKEMSSQEAQEQLIPESFETSPKPL